jgi:hypothetical protein
MADRRRGALRALASLSPATGIATARQCTVIGSAPPMPPPGRLMHRPHLKGGVPICQCAIHLAAGQPGNPGALAQNLGRSGTAWLLWKRRIDPLA